MRERGVGCCQCGCSECKVGVSAGKFGGSAGEHSLGGVWGGEAATWGMLARDEGAEGNNRVGRNRVSGAGRSPGSDGYRQAQMGLLLAQLQGTSGTPAAHPLCSSH